MLFKESLTNVNKLLLYQVLEWAKSRIGPSRFKSTRFGPQVDLTRFAVYGLTRLKQLDDGRYNCFACTSISF